MVRHRSGAVLLEVVVALTVLTIAGVSALTMSAASARAVRQAQARDREVRAASAFLDAVVLWTREDLDRRLGERRQGPWRLRIDRPAPALYTIVLTDSLSGVELLRTAVFRPESGRAAP